MNEKSKGWNYVFSYFDSSSFLPSFFTMFYKYLSINAYPFKRPQIRMLVNMVL